MGSAWVLGLSCLCLVAWLVWGCDTCVCGFMILFYVNCLVAIRLGCVGV